MVKPPRGNFLIYRFALGVRPERETINQPGAKP
jgi:hypothetical protein